jgi:hypothetical protein
MAVLNIVRRSALAAPAVLAPERYDPRRRLAPGRTDGVPLGELVAFVRRVVPPGPELGRCLVLDTSDAREGVIIARKPPVDGTALGSAKKVIEPGDVIVSRLRPYLRQVALVDGAIPNAAGVTLVGSTEFFVLRSHDEQSIAFLVPFLLSSPVQAVLAAGQEGGHHPRVAESVLRDLTVPRPLLARREALSESVRRSLERYRESERELDEAVAVVEGVLVGPMGGRRHSVDAAQGVRARRGRGH